VLVPRIEIKLNMEKQPRRLALALAPFWPTRLISANDRLRSGCSCRFLFTASTVPPHDQP